MTSTDMPDAVSRRQVLGIFGCAAGSLLLPARAGATEPDIVALAASKVDTTLYKATGRAVHRSTDGGRTWQDIKLPVPTGARIEAISLSAASPGAIYACGKRLGVMRNSDAGARWTSVGRGLPPGITAVAAHARQTDTVYAYAPGRGIYRSEDAGAHWQLMDAGPRGGITQFVHSDMPGSMQSGWLFVGGPKGVRLSMDCFCGWRNAGELASPAHAVTCDPRRPDHIAAATGLGVFESSDGGQSWSKPTQGPAPLVALAFGSDGSQYAAGRTHLYRRHGGSWESLDA